MEDALKYFLFSFISVVLERQSKPKGNFEFRVNRFHIKLPNLWSMVEYRLFCF